MDELRDWIVGFLRVFAVFFSILFAVICTMFLVDVYIMTPKIAKVFEGHKADCARDANSLGLSYEYTNELGCMVQLQDERWVNIKYVKVDPRGLTP